MCQLRGHHIPWWGLTVLLATAPACGAVAAAPSPLPVPPAWEFPIWWHAPFWTGTGYGDEATTYVAALLRSGRFQLHDLYITHSGDELRPGVARSMDADTRRLLQAHEHARLAGGRLSDTDMARPAIAICHSFPLCWGFANGSGGAMDSPGCPCPPPEAADKVAYRIGRTMFETDGLPAHLVERCNTMDEVWVPTEFNRLTFTAAGVTPSKLRVLGESVDTDRFDPVKGRRLRLRDLVFEGGTELVLGPRSRASLAASPFVFLSIFKWEARKGWDVLLDAYSQEFGADEGTELHIFTHWGGKAGGQELGERVRERLDRPRPALEALPHAWIHWHHVNDSLYPSLYSSANAVVLPTRGEGWGRPQMEAMAMGRPLITTNWSGPTAFTNDHVAYLIPVANITDATAVMDTIGFDETFRGQRWAQPSVPALRALMRRVFTHREEAASKGAAAREHVLRHYTPAIVSEQVEAELQRVEALLAHRRVDAGSSHVPHAQRAPHAASVVAVTLCADPRSACLPGAGAVPLLEPLL